MQKTYHNIRYNRQFHPMPSPCEDRSEARSMVISQHGIVATSQDMSEAFKRAINWVPEQERAPRVAQMVADVDAKYGAAAKSDHGLDIFRKRAASPTAQASLGPMVAPPLEIPRFRERVAPPSYSRFVATNYTSETMVFTKMIEIKAGFGGVVFGSEVRPDPALGKLNSVQWAADPADRSKGVLQFKFDGGATRTWGPVLYEDALTAMKMVSGGPNFPNWKPGDGIGLVGIDVEHPATYQSCSKDCAIQAARRWNLILHPVLTDKGLGWSAIMVDALPTNPAYFSELAKGKIGDAALQQLVDWERSNPGNYKFIDVPIRIVPVEGEGLSVLPMTPAAQRAGSPAVFLAVKPFGSEQKKETFQSAFPAVAPTLLKISVYHDRLNRFAPVLGIMRWARMSDAKIEVAGGTLNSVPTPGSVAIPDSGVVPLDAFETENSAREESVAAIDHTAAALIEALPAAVRGKITERRLAAARIRGYQVRIEAASNEMIPLSESNLAWVGRLAAKLEDIPDVKTAYQEIVGRISKAGSAAEKAFGTDEFAASLSELIGEQDRLNTWLHKAAPDFANERKQLDVKSYDLMRSMSEYLERIGEIRASMSSEEERRQVLIAQLPAASQTAYQGFIEERESSAKRATELNEEAESLAAASRDPARRNEALAAVPAEGQAMIREAEARADSLRQKAWAAEDEKTIRSAFDAAQKASDAAEQLRQKYLAGWYRENEKRRAEAVARFAEADGADKAAGAADDQARKILESAYPQIACIENLLAWSIDGVDE